jgi:hypothetical protein
MEGTDGAEKKHLLAVEATLSHVEAALVEAVATREVPASKVLCRSRRIDSTAMSEVIAAAERDIQAHLRASGSVCDGPKLVFFHDLITGDPYEVYPGTGTRFDVAYPVSA